MGLLELILIIVLIAWALGAFVIPVGGSAIHLLLVVVLVIVVMRLLRGQNVPL